MHPQSRRRVEGCELAEHCSDPHLQVEGQRGHGLRGKLRSDDELDAKSLKAREGEPDSQPAAPVDGHP